MANEITYTIEGNRRRSELCRYHAKPYPRNLSKGAKKGDIAQLKKAQSRNVVDLGNGDYDSRFTIGMEIEKSSLGRGARKELALMCGYERDSSCGYEAVTNILPLLPAGKWRNKVYNMMHEAKRVINDEYSPSNLNCGGHITVGCEGFTGRQLMDRVKKFSGILYAIYRMRLKNGYCRFNITMNTYSDSWKGIRVANPMKYQVALAKGGCLEFRLPSRFQSVKQMMRRYELMYILLDFAVNKPNASVNTFLKAVEPTIKLMYSGDAEKVAEIMRLAKSFQNFINTEKVTEDIKPFLGFDDIDNAVQGYERR